MADEKSWKAVQVPPIVQELAASTDEAPSLFVVPEQDRPSVAVSRMMPEPIPVVDLSQLSAASYNNDEAAKLRSALEKWGLFMAVGHGMEPSFLGEVRKTSREFFKLPMEEKQKYSNLVNGKDEFRIEGYGSNMVVAEHQILDWSDRFYLLVEPESRRNYSLWPTQPPSFKYVLSEYTARCREMANIILTNLARLLGLKDDYFVDMFDENAMAHARFNYYPHCPKPDHVLGLKAHTDASMITIISMDDTVSGLQVQNNGVWYDVPIVPNAILVNVGDTCEIMSNGSFKSPVHRVVTNAEKERLSLVMFYTMDPERVLEPAPELVDENRPGLYKKMKAKDYLAHHFETFAKGALYTARI